MRHFCRRDVLDWFGKVHARSIPALVALDHDVAGVPTRRNRYHNNQDANDDG